MSGTVILHGFGDERRFPWEGESPPFVVRMPYRKFYGLQLPAMSLFDPEPTNPTLTFHLEKWTEGSEPWAGLYRLTDIRKDW